MNTALQLQALHFITPEVRELTIGQHTYQVQPIRMGQLPALIRLTEGFLGELLLGDLRSDAVLPLLAVHGDSVIDTVALCANAERSDLDAMLPDQFVALAMLCVEVNFDFFSRALPMLQAAAPSVAPKLLAKLKQPATPAHSAS